MKNIFLQLLIPFGLMSMENLPIYSESFDDLNDLSIDQVEFCLGANYFMACKALAMAKNQGYPYVKILSYELHSKTERLTFVDSGTFPDGERIEFLDEDAKVEIVCFREKPNCLCACVDDYSDLITSFLEFEESED